MKKQLLWLLLLFCGNALAHPMPSSVVNLSVLENRIRGEAKIPLLELANAVGDERVTHLADPFFITYFTQHIQAVSGDKNWTTQVTDVGTVTDTDPMIGTYQEAVIHFTLTPPGTPYLRSFTFHYDAVMHQVVTHSALVYVQQDWSAGIQDGREAQQIGIIKMDVPTEKIYPLQINLEEGSAWKGFKSMAALGMQHIKEGTDHLLFLLVLLLPAMLLVKGRRWGGFGGLKYSLVRLLTIVTAFTIGHSVTLLAGASGWLKLPGQPVELVIAFSILVSAVHAVRPLFPGKEIFIAAGFGLIHGLAFAGVLSSLELSGSRLALSILGFNLGIELMQLFVIAVVVPWLMLLSKTPAYKWLRPAGAAAAGVAALAWMAQRITGKANAITDVVDLLTQYGPWLIAVLAAAALVLYAAFKLGNRKINLAS